MSLIVHIILFMAALLVVLFIVLILLVDTMSRVDFIKNNFPGLVKFAGRRVTIGILLSIAILLQAALGYELFTKDYPSPPTAPIIIFKYPSAPEVHFTIQPPPISRTRPPEATQVPTTVSAPNGIAIGRDNNGTANVYNGPKPPVCTLSSPTIEKW